MNMNEYIELEMRYIESANTDKYTRTKSLNRGFNNQYRSECPAMSARNYMRARRYSK